MAICMRERERDRPSLFNVFTSTADCIYGPVFDRLLLYNTSAGFYHVVIIICFSGPEFVLYR